MSFLRDIVDTSWNTYRSDGGRGIPLLIWGSPGIGKSAIIGSISKKSKIHNEVVVLSLRDPSDLCGLPVKVGTGINLYPPNWANRLVEAGGGILFFDELNCAASSVQAAALRVICERVVGDLILPKDTLILAACNPPEEGTNTSDLDPSISNRFCHFNIEPNLENFVNFITLGESDDVINDNINREEWEESYSHTSTLISKYLSSNRNSLLGNVEERSFASPRTWEMAARLWATCRCKNISVFDYISGCVGEGTAKEVFEFAAKMNVPTPKEVLYNSTMPDTIDRVYVAVMSTLSFVLKYNEHVPRFCNILDKGVPEDIVVQCIKALVKKELCNSEEFLKLSSNIL